MNGRRQEPLTASIGLTAVSKCRRSVIQQAAQIVGPVPRWAAVLCLPTRRSTLGRWSAQCAVAASTRHHGSKSEAYAIMITSRARCHASATVNRATFGCQDPGVCGHCCCAARSAKQANSIRCHVTLKPPGSEAGRQPERTLPRRVENHNPDSESDRRRF